MIAHKFVIVAALIYFLHSRFLCHWQVQKTSAPPKILPAKPKVYLVSSLSIPAQSCVNLCAAELE